MARDSFGASTPPTMASVAAFVLVVGVHPNQGVDVKFGAVDFAGHVDQAEPVIQRQLERHDQALQALAEVLLHQAALSSRTAAGGSSR